ncbi:NUDIX hydrolase [Fusobacterium sp. PH5-44]|uniref:NUDIX hydrolase n=1 Tax=unclassified Fusobacterium TaxID=2648384 RepID=UPI003D1E34B7
MDTKDLKFLKIAIKKHPESDIQLEYLEKQNAISALLLDSTGKNGLFVKQYRPGINKEIIEVPAGIIENNEDPLEALYREIREETGYSKDDYRFLYKPAQPLILSPGCSTEALYTYIIQLKSDNILPQELSLDFGEVLENQWIDIDSVNRITTDFKTIFLINLFELYKNNLM